MGGGRVLGAGSSAAEVAGVSAEAARVLSLEEEKEEDADDGESLDSIDEDDDVTDFSNGKAEASVFVQDEHVRKGAISLSVCFRYLQAAGGWPFVAAVVAFSLTSRVVNVGTSYWIREWTRRDEPRDGAGRRAEDLYFASVYLGMSCAWVVLFVMVHVTRSFGSYRASNIYHDSTIQRVFGAPLRFFDTTPVGRLLNLFGKEIMALDQFLLPNMTNLWQAFFELLFIFIVMGTIAPWFLLAALPIAYASWTVTSRLRASGIQLKRLEVVTKSPIYAMFSETLNGAVTIRAYGATPRFILETLRRVDANSRAYHLFWASRRWMDARLSSLSAVVVLVGGAAMVLASKSGA
ncbi:Multidrug resistance-associated protein 1, partial [Phlyctochytrium bullatum]